jgi:cytochrome c553
MNSSRRIAALRPLRRSSLILLSIAWLAPSATLAQGSVEAGRARAGVCAACHGADGNSLNPEWPSLASQHETYITSALQAFKKGTRQNVLMSGQATALSDQDIADLAAFFAAQPRQPKVADPALVRTGERLYRGGNKDTAISACIACHGPDGRGNAPAGYPAVAGQHASYTAAQLRAYRSGERSSDPNQMMRNVAARLTDTEIAAVASYIQGLR